MVYADCHITMQASILGQFLLAIVGPLTHASPFYDK